MEGFDAPTTRGRASVVAVLDGEALKPSRDVLPAVVWGGHVGWPAAPVLGTAAAARPFLEGVPIADALAAADAAEDAAALRRTSPAPEPAPTAMEGIANFFKNIDSVQERQATRRTPGASDTRDRLEQTILAMRASARRGAIRWTRRRPARTWRRWSANGFCDALAANFVGATAAVELCGWCRRGLAHWRRPSAARAAQASRDDRALADLEEALVLWRRPGGQPLAEIYRPLRRRKNVDQGARKLFYELVVVGAADAGVREASAQRKLDCENLADNAPGRALSERHPLALTEAARPRPRATLRVAGQPGPGRPRAVLAARISHRPVRRRPLKAGRRCINRRRRAAGHGRRGGHARRRSPRRSRRRTRGTCSRSTPT